MNFFSLKSNRLGRVQRVAYQRRDSTLLATVTGLEGNSATAYNRRCFNNNYGCFDFYAMASDTETKKKHRRVLRAGFTKAANDLDSLLKVEEPIHSNIEISWECLKPKFDDLRNCDNEVYEGLLESATEEQLIADLESGDAYVKRFTELRLRCAKVLEPKAADDVRSVASANSEFATDEGVPTGKRKFKLPQIEFKYYDDSIIDWLAFWSQFRKIHEDPGIDDSDKIEYLVQATVPGSRARQLVESFPVIGENYGKIIECKQDLEERIYKLRYM